MANQRSHVPKFGNWDRDNVPYTTYFDNARKEKVGVKMINPNDPEQNPDAFMFGNMSHENEMKLTPGIENVNYPENNHAVCAPPFRATSNKAVPAVKQQHEKLPVREEGEFHGYMEAATRHNSGKKSGNRQSSNSESSSDRSNSDHSLMQSHNRPALSRLRRNSAEGSSSYSSSSPPRQARARSTNTKVDQNPQRGASVPKFGAWDETDPKSGEGFTIIFNKVKEEKQIGAAKFPTIPSEPTIYSTGHKNHANSSSEPKIWCCCLFSRTNK